MPSMILGVNFLSLSMIQVERYTCLLGEPESEGTDSQLHLGWLVLQPPHDQNGDNGENLQ